MNTVMSLYGDKLPNFNAYIHINIVFTFYD